MRTNEPGSPSNGRAITRPTARSPVSISRAVRQAAYSSSSGTVCSCAATWKTLSADVYTIQSPVRWCCSPSRSMISVPEAATFPITPRPVASLKRSISSGGKPSGKVGNERSVMMPIISQCPVVVSIPRLRSASRPHTAGASARGGHPASGSTLPSPSCCSAGSSRPPTASATCPSVFDPAVPNRSASGRSPTPTASSTITQARAIPGNLDE